MTKLVRVDAKPLAPKPSGRRGYLIRGAIAPVFVERDALAPQDAIMFTPADGREARAFAAMRRAGVIRAAGTAWWLDIVAYQARAEARSRAAVPWLIGGAVALAAFAMLFYRG